MRFVHEANFLACHCRARGGLVPAALLCLADIPANSGDTVLYEQMATNWLQHHVYAMDVDGQITPVDLRMPGYPAFLAIVYAITGRTGPDARLCVMIAQAFVDLLSCVLIAAAGGDAGR